MKFAKKTLREVEDSAVEHGLSAIQEARFPRRDLGAEQTGLNFLTVKPDQREAFAHRHRSAEEIYVVIGGGGRVKLDDELVELAPLDAVLASFEPDAYAREPAGAGYVHQGPDGLRAFYARLFSNGGGIPLEHCALMGTERICALEYNIVRWGRSELPPEAGVAVYVRAGGGRLTAARIYDDADPPIRAR